MSTYEKDSTGTLHKQRMMHCAGGYEPPPEKPAAEQTVMPWGK